MAKKNHELIRSLRVLKQQLNRDIENKGAECEVYARDGERPTWHANAYGHLQGLKMALCYVEGHLERAET